MNHFFSDNTYQDLARTSPHVRNERLKRKGEKSATINEEGTTLIQKAPTLCEMLKEKNRKKE